ncbi:DUF637 domain-containing protein, partial [Halocynthiibacter sp.]|uniref:DUF637 domain-containing protein n=1 Tax=Halocynthiibacter sp. TaxID=1979210 RepID=UPI003C496A94
TVGVIDGAVTGNLDLGEIVKNAAFSGFTAGLTSGINLEQIGIKLDNTGLLRSGGKLTLSAIGESALDSALRSGLNTAVYGSDFGKGLLSGISGSVVNLAMADVQHGIGDLFEGGANGGEGSFGHITLHALTGCVAAELQNASCASGAAGAAAQAIYAGTDPGAGTLTDDQIKNRAELIGGIAGFFASEGKGENVSTAASIARSGAENNYLSHQEGLFQYHAKRALEDCLANDQCTDAEIAALQDTLTYWQELDESRDANLVSACIADSGSHACIVNVKALLASQGHYNPQAGNPVATNMGPVPYRKLVGMVERQGEDALFDGTVRGNALKALWEEYQHNEETLRALPPSVVDAAYRDVSLDYAVAAVLAGTGVVGVRGTTVGGRQPGMGNVNSTQLNAPGYLPRSYTRNADGSINGPGPNGGARATDSGYSLNGRTIWQRDSGGHYVIGANGRQIQIGSPSAHGNTLGSQPTVLYRRVDEFGNFEKWGISQNPATRYTDAELGLSFPQPVRAYPRNQGAAVERFLTERWPGPLNREPWAGRRNPSHPNYDPNYVPPHLRGPRINQTGGD